jgi:MFS family permease
MPTQDANKPVERDSAAAAAPSALSPFRHRVFAVIWTATVISNIGTWMYNAASGWLMTTLNGAPVAVSLVQVANTLPLFLFAVPAGALADIVDKRKFLIGAEIATTVASAAFAALVSLNLVSPYSLLLFMFLIGIAATMGAPAWQAVVPQRGPRAVLSPAIAANSVGVNISRAIGPALAGVLIAILGIAAPFWINAISNLATVAALLWWRSPPNTRSRLPTERFFSAIRTGLRHARYNLVLRATSMRAIAFFLFASTYWALLPLVSRNQVGGGPALYGGLLGAIGAGAIAGSVLLPRMKARWEADRIVEIGTLGTALALVLFGIAREPAVALLASVIAGVSWIVVVSTLNVSAQLALPDWVRGRGLAMFATVFFGAMTFGSVAWGAIAGAVGLPDSHFIAGAACIAAIPLTRRWHLQKGIGVELTPSMHWPAPVTAQEIEYQQGPVLVTVEYRVLPEHRKAFLKALESLAHERRRDGAYTWHIFEDTAEPNRYLETFLIESWLEHLRQHERVTNADRILEERVQRFLKAKPAIAHLISASDGGG